jgi:hypothetical protein
MGYKLVEVVKSDRSGKKYKAVFLNHESGRTKTTHFGASGMEDYTQHHDKERRQRYRDRHQKDLETQDPTRAGFLSYYILWGDSTSFKTNLSAFKRRFSL